MDKVSKSAQKGIKKGNFIYPTINRPTFSLLAHERENILCISYMEKVGRVGDRIVTTLCGLDNRGARGVKEMTIP